MRHDLLRRMHGADEWRSGEILHRLCGASRWREITTVEGLEMAGELHPIQKAFGDCYGLQCGYCTPGLMLSALQLLKDNSSPTQKEIRKAIAGNTCRCTGYQNILKAIETAAAKMRSASHGD